jgi:predicted house-cleaning noncanonical NTP pyrophosphatase (MazG superfamily)
MERIIIEVSEKTAKNWRLTSEKFKSVIAQKIDKDIEAIFEANKKENFMAYLDELSDKMQQRGLTEEILADILKGDE